MRNKTISLCPTTYEIANKMENFSQFVRQKVRSYRDDKQSQLDLDWVVKENDNLHELLGEIREGKKAWVSPHGWLKVGEEE